MNENFSNGLQKLYNCVSKGLGSIMIPQEVRNIIDKEAKQIDMLEMDGGITDKAISLCNDMEQPLGEVKELYRRTCSRMLYQEMRKQKNIEDVVNEAKAILQDENEVADEVVNEDWLMRFFNSIQDISNTDMQKLWGKVLAGEIKSPNSFTLRSLDTLSKITKQEATLFEELRPYIINYRGTFAILNDDEINKIIDKFQKQTNNINSNDGEAFKTMYSKELRPYEEVISLIDFTLGGTYMDQYKKILEVKTPINFVELWKDKTNCTAKTQSFKSGYSKGYQRFLKKNMDLFLFMSIMLAICLSKMFSQDKEERMNEIISTTKNRGTNHFVAKVIAGIIISSFYYLLALVPFLIIIFSIYGLAGWDVNVQLGIAPLFPNLLTYGQLLSRAILMGLLASVLMGLLIMFFSKVFLSSSVSVICSIILCFIPNIMISLLNISSSSILRYCFPITMVDVSSVLNFDMTKLLFTLLLFFFLTFILIYDKKRLIQ